jgi:hypothetical protein
LFDRRVDQTGYGFGRRLVRFVPLFLVQVEQQFIAGSAFLLFASFTFGGSADGSECHWVLGSLLIEMACGRFGDLGEPAET